MQEPANEEDTNDPSSVDLGSTSGVEDYHRSTECSDEENNATTSKEAGRPSQTRKRKMEQKIVVEKRMGEALTMLKQVANKPKEVAIL